MPSNGIHGFDETPLPRRAPAPHHPPKAHELLLAALRGRGYSVQQFIISPHQLGVPYSRCGRVTA